MTTTLSYVFLKCLVLQNNTLDHGILCMNRMMSILLRYCTSHPRDISNTTLYAHSWANMSLRCNQHTMTNAVAWPCFLFLSLVLSSLSHVLLAQERPNTRVIFYALLVSSFFKYTLIYLYFLFDCFEKLDKMPTMHLFYTGTSKMEAYFMFYLQLSRRPKNDVSCYKYNQIPLKTRYISP